MTEDVKLPPDLEWKLMVIHQQHLTVQYDEMRRILLSHEREMAGMWVLFFGAIVLYLIKESDRGRIEKA